MPKRRVRKKNGQNRKYFYIILVLFLVVAGVFLFTEEPDRVKTPVATPDIHEEDRKPDSAAGDILPELKAPPPAEVPDIPDGSLPKVSVVMDDLGNNKESALRILGMDSPLTLSILPGRTYSSWIAEEGARLGHDVILHVPMEATRPFKLGGGGIYTRMKEEEIISVLNADIRAVPNIIGVSNHMGSAVTRDKKVMGTVVQELKRHGLFFLDSITTSKSVGYETAKKHGVRALRRDVFLDNSEDPVNIKTQWDRLVAISKKKGYAIALAHPRKNTLDFLQETLKDNKDVEIVPISELVRSGVRP